MNQVFLEANSCRPFWERAERPFTLAGWMAGGNPNAPSSAPCSASGGSDTDHFRRMRRARGEVGCPGRPALAVLRFSVRALHCEPLALALAICLLSSGLEVESRAADAAAEGRLQSRLTLGVRPLSLLFPASLSASEGANRALLESLRSWEY